GDDGRQASRVVIDAVVFDLDGTLWDTSASCAVAWNRVLDRHRIPFRPITEHDVRGVTGKPHEECIRAVFAGLDEAHIQTLAAETQLEDNRVVAELGGELFADVKAGLKRLCASYPLFIVSNCQAGYIETFFQWSNLGGCFRDFECWGNTGLSKTENLRVLLSTPPAPRPPARPARLDGSESIPYTGGATCDRRNRDGDVLEGDHGQLGRIGPLWARLLPAYRRLVQRHRARAVPRDRLSDRADDQERPHHVRDGRDPLPVHRAGGLRRPDREHDHPRRGRQPHPALELQG